MSYLDTPRLHFSGSFFSNPSTQNNSKASFPPGATVVPMWNPMGMHWFYLKDCTVKTAIGPDGNAAPADAAVGGQVETTNDPAYGRMVDIDPDYQQASQIWGAQFKVSLKGGGGEFKGKLQTATLRDLWLARVLNLPGNLRLAGASGVYQSVFKELTFQSASAHRSLPHSVRHRQSPLNLSSMDTTRPKVPRHSTKAELSARSVHLDRLTGMRLPVWI